MGKPLSVLTLGAVLALITNASASAATMAYIESGGVVVGEGEQFSARTSVGGNAAWVIVPGEAAAVGDTFENARGGAFVQTQPDGAGGLGPTNPPSIEYKMVISTPGTYQLYMRWDGFDGASDSMFADVVELKDGAGGTIPDWYEFQKVGDDNFATTPWDAGAGFEENEATPANDPAVFDIVSAGLYTLRFSQREDGSALDAFVFQLSNLAAPTGNGPAVSDFVELAPVPEPASLAIWSLLGVVAAGLLIARRRKKAH